MSPSENCRGLSTSRARMMSPAHVPKIGRPRPWNFSRAGAKSQASMSLSKVVDSPPGMMSPSTSSSSDGLRTSTASTPHCSSARAWSAKSPWSASTPMRNRVLPAPRLEQLLLRELRGLDADHGVAELLADARQHVRVLEVRGGLHDGAGPLRRIARLEDPGADEGGFRAELHHQGGGGGGRDSARREVRHRELARLGDPAQQLVRGAQVLRLGHQLLGRERREPPDAGDDGAHVADCLDDVAGAGLALRTDHGRSFADAPERLAQIAAAADEGDAEGELVDVEVLVRGRQHLGLVDVVDRESFQDLRLDEVPDPRLRHDRDGDRLLDLLDLLDG